MSHHSLEGFTPISSDHMDGARYNHTERKMTIRYKNGYVYEVHGVSPEHYQEFMEAPSQGNFYHQNIKGNFHVERVR